MNQDDLIQRVVRCSIENDYDGLSELEEHACSAPDEAGDITWKTLCNRDDPGRDDHALCVNLTEICIQCFDGDTYSQMLTDSWAQLPTEIRENTINGFEIAGVDKPTVVNLYTSELTELSERHRILAVIVSNRCLEFRGVLPKMLDSIGQYDAPNRQLGLTRLVVVDGMC